ncbi:MAG: 3-deoxy-D-manno-octulosonic acid transferase [Pigmentiphaga sp.]|nr:3-deoxy-D-manno-octulosonic acid transferase [Pigmentiphaga sp.]
MARWFYTGLLALVAPLFWWRLARRARREGGDWQVLHPHRFGRGWQCRTAPSPVWVHAVSLGETRAAEPLLAALLGQGLPVLLTHTTATARDAAAARFADAIREGQLQQAWLPYDFPGAMRRFVAAARPRVLLLIEREIWPNLLHACGRAGVPAVLVNARLSARSARVLARLGLWMRPALRGLAAVLAQTADDAARLQALGAPRPVVTGNLKFDVRLDPAEAAEGRRWRAAWARPVIILASTRDGEEARLLEAVLAAEAGVGRGSEAVERAEVAAAAVAGGNVASTVSQTEGEDPTAEEADKAPEAGGGREVRGNEESGALRPLWLVVPRHARRFDEVAALLTRAGVAWQRRAALPDPLALAPDCRWLLGDSMGEMARYYGAADIAILGGSFEDFGGQNLLEACAVGVPVLVGPSVRNFAEAVADAVRAGAACQVAEPAAAVALARDWLARPDERRRHAAATLAFVAEHQGATARTLACLTTFLSARLAGHGEVGEAKSAGAEGSPE